MTNSHNNILKYLVNNTIALLVAESLGTSKSTFDLLYKLIQEGFSNANVSFNLETKLKNTILPFLEESAIYKNEYTLNTNNTENKTINHVVNKLTSSLFIILYYKILVSLLYSLEKEFNNHVLSIASKISNSKKLSFSQINKENYYIIYNSLNLGKLLKSSLENFNIEFKNIKTNILFNEPNIEIDKDIIIQTLDLLNEVFTDSLTTILVHSDIIEQVRINLLGKNSLIANESKNLNKLSIEEKKIKGTFLNILKNSLNDIIINAKNILNNYYLQQNLIKETEDISLPVYSLNTGGIHPISYLLEEVVNIFNELGFNIVEGPEIDTEWYNFTALNFNEYHPAKDNHDTFYFKKDPKKLLRTHTSTVQIRAMQNYKLPLQIIVPGKVYRSDDDSTHTPMFHQLEGLYINTNVSVAELKYTLINFCRKFFNIPDLPLRFRPSYFPFTSPSLEVDINCKITKEGVIIGKGDDWLEILGCGMVHPNILKICNINPKQYTGFAFGLGIERLAMLKYGFPDLRDFFTNNYMWLQAYNFNTISTLCQNIK